MIRVVVCGACGRMGRLIIRWISNQKDMKLVGAVEAAVSPEIGKDAGEVAGIGKTGVRIVGSNRLRELLEGSKPDVLVDFTNASAALENVKAAADAGVAVVVGTTGFTEEQMKILEETIERGGIPAVISPNMSVGVNVFFKSIEHTARMLGPEYDVEIVEVHHIHKKDAPSGTAKKAARILAGALGKKEGEIRIKSIREGEVVGEHTVIFSVPEERIEIAHRANSREAFVSGVIKAIRYVAEKGKRGRIHDMDDVLGLK